MPGELNRSPTSPGSVLDGAPVDWAAAESSADQDERPIVRQLRVIEGLAAVHRREPSPARTQTLTSALFTTRRRRAPEQWGHLRILERDRSRRVRRGLSRLGHAPRSRSRAEAAACARTRPTTRASVDHRRRPAARAGPPSERRHDPRRRADRRPDRPVDGVRRGPDARAAARSDGTAFSAAEVDRASASSCAARSPPSTPPGCCIATSRRTTSCAPRTAASC